jgi:hypothetical protein
MWTKYHCLQAISGLLFVKKKKRRDVCDFYISHSHDQRLNDLLLIDWLLVAFYLRLFQQIMCLQKKGKFSNPPTLKRKLPYHKINYFLMFLIVYLFSKQINVSPLLCHIYSLSPLTWNFRSNSYFNCWCFQTTIQSRGCFAGQFNTSDLSFLSQEVR